MICKNIIQSKFKKGITQQSNPGRSDPAQAGERSTGWAGLKEISYRSKIILRFLFEHYPPPIFSNKFF